MKAGTQFHLLSFEGPDAYSRAGGLSSRVTGLSEALARAGFETHLWFVGDPGFPGHELESSVNLHRWCQWISRYHPMGVYDGEEGKQREYASTLPPYLMRNVLSPHLRRGGHAVVLAEEWQTVNAVIHLDWLLRLAGSRDEVAMFWNANNTFGFGDIEWPKLGEAAEITTVSHYMRKVMQPWGVDPLVVHNGLSPEAFFPPEVGDLYEFRSRLTGRAVLCKVARWDPDKRWMSTLNIIQALKQRGERPLLIARGGLEPYGAEVLEAARALGLRVVERMFECPGARGLLEILSQLDGADIVNLRSAIDSPCRRVLFCCADAVLANSRHEPFGLVGLETMAVGGLACTGGTGEDYAIPDRNALVMETGEPGEFLTSFQRTRKEPELDRALRQAGRRTAEHYSWSNVLETELLPRLSFTVPDVELRPTA